MIGWYHSHPGYGCWLSGIDVSTQMLNQQFQEPFVAIVVCIIIVVGLFILRSLLHKYTATPLYLSPIYGNSIITWSPRGSQIFFQFTIV